ncbi:hypothetical protein OAC85_02850 [Flavobacteriaceae bacterium]|nr:hypothetical protein [Flavobacteriaceae bacterium]
MRIKHNSMLLGILVFLLLFVQTTFAQRGIGTNTPNEHSVLELVSNNKGLLLPRLSLTSSGTFLSGSATASDNSLLVYNTSTVTNTGLSGPGFYYWAGGATGNWNLIGSGGATAVAATVTNSTQRWNGAAWVEATNFLNSGTTTATFTANLTVTGTAVVENITLGNGAGNHASNTGLGVSTLNNTTAVAINNTGTGYLALSENTTGNDNSAFGANALAENLTGSRNVALGSFALEKNTTGFENVALGESTLPNNRTGSQNIAIGPDALANNVAGSGGIAIGYWSQRNINTTATGFDNTNISIGNKSMGTAIITGLDNIGIGTQALNFISSGNNNIGIGSMALVNLRFGSNNTVVGDNSGTGLDFGNNNTILGANVAVSSTLSGTVILADGNGTHRFFANDDGYVGLGTSTPNAALEITSSDMGLIIPRISINNSTSFTNGAATAAHNSMLVYNTNTVTATTGLSGPGFYYWEGAAAGSWVRIATGSGLVGTQTNSTQRWDGTAWVEATNFLNSGTTTATLATNLTVTGTLVVTGAGASIGGAAAQASAILDLSNTTNKALLLPQTQTASITTPAAGMLTYDPTTADLHFRDNSQWVRLGYRTVTDEEVFVDTVFPSGFLYVVLLVDGDWKAVKYQKDDPNYETTATSATNGGASRPTTLAACQALSYN